MSQNEGTKPFSKGARLGGNSVEFSRKAIGSYCGGCRGGHKLGFLKPSQKVLSVRQPFNHRVCRRTN